MARYHGKNMKFYLAADGSAAAAPVARVADATLNFASETDDVTVPGDANKQYVAGIPDGTGEISGVWDDTDDALYDAGHSTDTGKRFYFYPSSLVPTKYLYGLCGLSFNDMSAGVGGGIRFSAAIHARGDWTWM